jgi:hypothetical protein
MLILRAGRWVFGKNQNAVWLMGGKEGRSTSYYGFQAVHVPSIVGFAVTPFACLF